MKQKNKKQYDCGEFRVLNALLKSNPQQESAYTKSRFSAAHEIQSSVFVSSQWVEVRALWPCANNMLIASFKCYETSW